MIVTHLESTSGKPYGFGTMDTGKSQYCDRDYYFNRVPEELEGCVHVLTHGDDKLISENEICLSFEIDSAADVYILFADKFPVLPSWLEKWERMRMNVTRKDTEADSLKGYFGLFRKSFGPGKVKLGGCSPESMLAHDWYVSSMGSTYCMYTLCIKEKQFR